MWYSIENRESIVTPALAVYRHRVVANIAQMLAIAGGPERLCPHVKTHKMAEVSHLYLQAGVRQFKCSTIAEAEMLAQCGADLVVLAYQPVGPQASRFVGLIKKFPSVGFSTITDDRTVVRKLSALAVEAGVDIDVMLDVDVGMHRTGIPVGAQAETIYREIGKLPSLTQGGLHVYDGHIHDRDVAARRKNVEQAFKPVSEFRESLLARDCKVPRLITGGTASFPIHASYPGRICSPGTCIFWDAGYSQLFSDLPFQVAAVLLTRVISKPADDLLCVDLGYKAIAAENPPPRAHFLNLDDALEIGHTEEHLVLSTPQAKAHAVGDLLYVIPRHICPTVALHQQAYLVENGRATDTWKVTARDRILSI